MKFSLFIVCLCTFSFIKCTTIAESRKSAQFTQKMDKVYFVIETVQLTPMIDPAFIQSFESELNAALEGKKIAVSYAPYSPLMSKTDVQLRTTEIQPTYVMRLNGSIDFNAFNGSFFDVQINPQNSDKILWRCSLRRSLGYWNKTESVKNTVNTLVAQMQKDGIL